MHTTILTSSNSRLGGGVSEVTSQLAVALQERMKDNISVLSYNDAFSPNDIWKYDKVKMEYYHRTKIPVLRTLGFSWDVSKKLNLLGPDVIDSQGLWMYFSAASLMQKRKNGTKIIITPHGMLDSWAIKKSVWKKKIVGLLYEYQHLKKADCIKALCQSEYESIRKYGLANPVAIIPNGINIPEDKDYSCFRDKKEKTLLFIGRINPKKGIRELIKGIALLKREKEELLESWNINIAGWDQNGHQKELEGLVRDLDLCKYIHFIGPVFGKEKEDSLCQANAFILSSFSEGLPMSILEAWSYQLPVVMTKECNIPSGFAKNAAIKIAPTPESIFQGLCQLFSMDPQKLKEMGQNGYNLVREDYSWENIARMNINLYEWVIGQCDKPAFVFE